MTDFAAFLQPDRGQPAVSLHAVTAEGFEAWLAQQPARARVGAQAATFTGKPATMAVLPGDSADAWSVAFAPGDEAPWALAHLPPRLPAGTYRLQSPGAGALGWLLAQHRFARYRSVDDPAPRVLLSGDAAQIADAVRIAEAIALVRDLVDTPSGDMGPAELAEAVQAVSRAHGGTVTITQGDALSQGFPMIHAVGRAATRARAPRLIELEWGDPAHSRIALIGKGVCFDSGGLDIKPAAGMLLMKKDMGGAAHALALAQLVMAARLPVRLHLLITAVENAISAESFRPGDVLRSRKGITVEIGNTDAEGRLILADALTKAAESSPTLMLDFATLTGAARVALGPDLPALFANDDALAGSLLAAGREAHDPLWRMPLWKPYARMLKSDVADIDNAGAGGFAGAVTAALFLDRFVDAATPWAHFDTFAWNPSARPGRPKGGAALGLHAAFTMLRARFAA